MPGFADQTGFAYVTSSDGAWRILPAIATTRPWFTSTYVAVTHAADSRHFAGFDDAWLKSARIGLQLITGGDVNPPPAMSLSRRHITNNITGFNLVPGFPKNGNTLFQGFGGRCESDNDGDPIVQYDQFADRWILTQFAVSSTPYTQCVAVSTTSARTRRILQQRA